ncbi:MAG TPA: DUF4124 domain-containing protein [Limnobacter sp.]|nr:DUF4124 domain-containing protein [Limnobacter sp.]
MSIRSQAFHFVCLSSLALVAISPSVAMSKGTEMYVCTSSDGVRTYQNSSSGEGCVPLNLNPITVVPGPSSRNVGKSPDSSGMGSSARAAARQDTRQAMDFDAKNDRMKILQEELRIEESKLKSLKDEYKNGQPERLGSEKNYQKYLDRVARLEQEIMVTNENIEILKTELIKLSN